MIELTTPDGETILVNPFHIFAVKPMGAGSMVMASGETGFVVRENVEEVGRMIRTWTKDGE